MINTDDDDIYPVPNRSPEVNRRISAHESGHALLARCLGSNVHLVTIVPGHGFEGRCVRSGPPSNFDFDSDPEVQHREVLTVCEQLASLGPTLGSSRVADAEIYIRAQTTVIEPDWPSRWLGTEGIPVSHPIGRS